MSKSLSDVMIMSASGYGKYYDFSFKSPGSLHRLKMTAKSLEVYKKRDEIYAIRKL